MSEYRNDESIKSANTPTSDSYQERAKDYSVYRCVVVTAKYVDEEANPTKNSTVPEMVYDCKIIGGFREGQTVPNARVIQNSGGHNNYSERVYKASSSSTKNKKLNEQDGDIVFVAFVAGDQNAAVILGGGNHMLDFEKTGAKKADGPRLKDQYNGILTLIDKDGDFTLTRLGGEYKADTGEFIPDEDGAAVVVKYHNNRILESVKKETVVNVIEGDTETITRFFKTGLKVLEDGANDKVEITTKGGLKVTSDGKEDKFIAETKGGAVLTVDGASKEVTITSGAATITIDAAGKVTVSADNIDLGKAVTDLVTKFNELASAYDSHTHTFLDNTSGGPPVLKATDPTIPLLSSVGSLTVKVQD